ncbi:MAG: carboxymuconolactone decarboxylase family protein [Methanomassiliicoccales archaeon]|nr:carboxymuconolactone decarboxylase family protein [Methanomassiliicoccales archaeon]
MDEQEQRLRLERILAKVKAEYGFVPTVSEVMSERPDVFIPYSEISSSLFFHPKFMDRQTAELAAISAGTAMGSENCLNVHIGQALKLGVSEDAVLEAMLIGSLMSMNRSNSVAFRCLKSVKEGQR